MSNTLSIGCVKQRIPRPASCAGVKHFGELNRQGRLAYNRGQMTNELSFNIFQYFLSDEKLNAIGERVAIEFRGQHVTYNELSSRVRCWAEELSRRGVKEGDRVALLLYDSPEFNVGFLATVALGAICVPINTYLNPEEIRFILKDSGATLFIGEQELTDKIIHLGLVDNQDKNVEVLRIVEPDRQSFEIRQQKSAADKSAEDLPIASGVMALANPVTTEQTPALLLYTSGSTGTPKGALHVQGNVAATVEGFGKSVLQLQASDRVFSASRLYFAYGLGNSLSFPIAFGATVILESQRPTPQLIAGIFRQQKPTVFFAVPAVYRALLDLQAKDASVDTSTLRMCISAGEALPSVIFEEWKTVFGLTILDGIGSTEMLHMFISNRQGEARAASSGKEVPGYEAKILDDAGQPTPVGDQGNLWVKGESAMVGYWQRDDLTNFVLRDGWFRTGDVYRQDEDGYYFHIGRSDDCFKVKGLWISPIEIEEVLTAHPEVTEAAVVVGTDEFGLATAKAYLVIRNYDDNLKAELYEFTKARLPLYKTPTQYEFVKEMPRTSTGKIQRFKLRVKTE
jgi:benzoate-CoA ligase